MRKLLVFVFAAALIAAPLVAEAVTTTTVTPTIVTKNPTYLAYKIALPASFAAGDTVYAVVPSPAAAGYISKDDDAGTVVTNMLISFSGSAAGDSVRAQIDAGGPQAQYEGIHSAKWVNFKVYALTGVGDMVGTTPYDWVAAGASTTYLQFPYWRFKIVNKGATLTSKAYYIQYVKN